MQLKKENLKNYFWAPKLVYQSPKQPEYIIGIYTDILSFFYWKTVSAPHLIPPPLPLLSLREQRSECLKRLKELLSGWWYVRGWSTQADTK